MKYLSLPLMAMLLMASITVSADIDVSEKLKNDLKQQFPDMQVQSMTELADSGLYEAIINDDVYYFTGDGKYLIQGNVLSIETQQNLTQKRKLEIKKAILDRQDPETMITFAPENPDYMLTVFTDIDCGYCRQMHEQIADYNAQGIGFRYMAFPRAGLESESAEKLVQVWCAKDRQQALTDAKAEGELPGGKTCKDNPVISHYELAGKLGVQGTPALFLENGQMLPGYVPPKRLREILDEQAKSSD